jgi:hypothetical protein
MTIMGQTQLDWNTMKGFLGQPSMKEDLMNFDSRKITPKIAAAVDKVISGSPDSFEPEVRLHSCFHSFEPEARLHSLMLSLANSWQFLFTPSPLRLFMCLLVTVNFCQKIAKASVAAAPLAAWYTFNSR